MSSLYKRNHITEDNNDLTVWADGPTADCPMRTQAITLDIVDDDGGSTQLSLNPDDAAFSIGCSAKPSLP